MSVKCSLKPKGGGKWKLNFFTAIFAGNMPLFIGLSFAKRMNVPNVCFIINEEGLWKSRLSRQFTLPATLNSGRQPTKK